MANTYGDVYIHAVFAVKRRQQLIHPDWKEDLNKYISGIITRKNVKSIIVNCMPDHMHVFFSMKSNTLIADIIRDIKNNSAKFINEQKLIQGKFEWQAGYGFFSYSSSDVPKIYNYILNQETHHKKFNFKEEYVGLLNKFKIPFEDNYLFEFID
jgi:putative transposase